VFDFIGTPGMEENLFICKQLLYFSSFKTQGSLGYPNMGEVHGLFASNVVVF